jgi:outer membrane receptor protein involved in Fe transport
MFRAVNGRRERLLASACALAILMPVTTRAEEEAITVPAITVTGTGESKQRAETPGSVSIIGSETIDLVKPTHPSEILNRVPGVAVEQTNGEGHITGIRQPIGTSPVYLYLEDGVPVQASGFFNHNALYLMDLPQAGGVEVTRGPGTALQGNDAIGGVVNVLTRPPSLTPEADVSVEGGSYTWLRALATASDTWGDLGARGDLNLTHTDGWRDASGYDRQTVVLRVDKDLSTDTMLKAVVTANNIDQQTGALSYLSELDYKNDPTRNYTPIAFREVQSVRGSVAWEQEGRGSLLSFTPYVRSTVMKLLPSWQLSYDPVVYEVGYASIGMLAKYRRDFSPWRTRLITGIDLDYSPGFHNEDRLRTTKSGPVFTSYSNLGRLYDYDITFWQASPYVQGETSPLADLRVTAGLRFDTLGFLYDNNLPDGAFVTPTPFGNRTFFRPPSTDLSYTHASPSVGATYAFTPSLNGFVSYKQSFRVPEEGQLFRQGNNADSIHLEPVTADNYEVGLRGAGMDGLTWELSLYRTIKDNDILTTRTGIGPTQTNNGKTEHTGIEVALGWQFLSEWRLDAAGSYARHEYKRWVTLVSGATVDYSGNEISMAPRTIGDVTLRYTPRGLAGLAIEAEWIHLGWYWMDDANTQKYGGHDLANLRATYAVLEGLEIFGRVMNVFDSRWATAAQVSNGQPQFAPGLPLTFYAGISKRF